MEVDTKQVRQFERALGDISKTGVAYANRNALNQVAFAGRKIWIRQVANELTLRNTFTTRQIRVVKATGTNVHKMRATLGSLAPYMDEREDGETKRTRGKHGVAVPTAAAAGQTGRRRTKLVRKAFALRAIKLQSRGSGSEKQRNAVAIRKAFASGKRVAFLQKGNLRGLVRISGRRSKPQFRTIYNLNKASIRVRAHPTLGPTMAEARRFAPFVFKHELQTQITRAIAFRMAKTR